MYGPTHTLVCFGLWNLYISQTSGRPPGMPVIGGNMQPPGALCRLCFCLAVEWKMELLVKTGFGSTSRTSQPKSNPSSSSFFFIL